MSKVVAIAARELSGRRSIFLVAGVLALLPYALLLLPTVARYGRNEVISMGGAAIAVCYVFGLALALGTTFVERDVAAKRISFYFSKPLSGNAIWFGKLLGALATIFACAAIIIVPVFAGAPEEAIRLMRGFGYFVLGTLALFLAGHVIATMFRSRSSLIGLDLLALCACGGLAYWMTYLLSRGAAHSLTRGLLWTLGIGTLLVLTGAGAWQLSRARVDVRSNHRELSRFVWSGLAILFAITGAALLWIVSPGPDSLERYSAGQVPYSNWVILFGRGKYRGDYQLGFAKNVVTGEYVRIPVNHMWWGGFHTPDGKLVGQLNHRGDLQLLRFTGDRVDVTNTNLTLPLRETIIPSDDGSRIVVLGENNIVVRSLENGDTLAAIRRPSPDVRAFFVTRDVLRMYATTRQQLQIFELHVPTKRLTQTGAIDTDRGQSVALNAEGTRMVVHGPRGGANELLIADARTGAILGAFGSVAHKKFGALLSDGRIALFDVTNLQKIAIYKPDLTLEREIVAPGIKRVWLFRELEGSRVVVGGNLAGLTDTEVRNWTMHVVDLNSGAIVRTDRQLRPLQMTVQEGLRRTVIPANAPLIGFDANRKLTRFVL